MSFWNLVFGISLLMLKQLKILGRITFTNVNDNRIKQGYLECSCFQRSSCRFSADSKTIRNKFKSTGYKKEKYFDNSSTSYIRDTTKLFAWVIFQPHSLINMLEYLPIICTSTICAQDYLKVWFSDLETFTIALYISFPQHLLGQEENIW